MMSNSGVKSSGVKIVPRSDLRVGTASGSSSANKAKSNHVQIFNICTYNNRTLRSEEKLIELEKELEQIKWSIVGLCETRRKGEECLKLKSGNVLYYKGDEDGKYNGIGFLVNKEIGQNIITMEGSSSRVGRLVLKLNDRYKLQIVQAYAPTSSHTDEEVEQFYEELKEMHEKGNDCQFKIVMGDFNAKIGTKLHGETVIGNYGFGNRNDRGNRLVQFAEEKRLYIMNSFFKKQPTRKWTWFSPDREVKNEIDFITTNQKHIVKDVTVLNKFNTGSDHRLVRARIEVDIKCERRKLITKKREMINIELLKNKKVEFQSHLGSQLQTASAETIGEIIMSTAKQIGGTIKSQKTKKLSDDTLDLLKKRREMKVDNTRDKIEYSEMCKTIRKRMKEDIEKFNLDAVQKAIEKRKSYKKAKQKLMIGKNQIIAMEGQNGRITDKDQIVEHIMSFYKTLYQSTETEDQSIIEENVMDEEILEILPEEVTSAIKSMKSDKAAGNDEVTIDVLKLTGPETAKVLAKIFTACLVKSEIPQEWNHAKIILLFKKGSIFDIKNYRPICLLSVMYKVFTKILTNRLTKILDNAQPVEQAGFRNNFSTIDHILTLREVMSRAREYKMPLTIAFIDFEKAFDSATFSAVFQSLREQGVHPCYTKLLTNIYQKSTAFISLDKPSEEFPIQRGVKQGDPISPKLFSAVLEMTMSKLQWRNRGININGRKLSNLRFADDIVLFSNNTRELQTMLKEMSKVAREVGLKMNLSKTKVMSNKFCAAESVTVDNKVLESVEDYVKASYLSASNGEVYVEHQKTRQKKGCGYQETDPNPGCLSTCKIIKMELGGAHRKND
ncbi:hypothetical protein WDU94_003496 [Cyamophila willieti]